MPTLMFMLLIFILTIVYSIKLINYSHGRIYLNSLFFISFGFAFYLILPLVMYCYILNFYSDSKQLMLVYGYLPDVGSMTEFSLIFYCSFVSMLVGYLILSVNNRKKYDRFENIAYRKFYLYVLRNICLLCINILLIISFFIRGQFFKGYTELFQGGGISSITTTFIALTNMFFVFAAMYSLIRHRDTTAKIFLLDPIMKISYFFMVLSISLGGRMAVVSCITAIIMICTKFFSLSFTLKSLLFSGLAASFLMGVFGLVRIGAGDGGFSDVYLNVISDPLYTSITLFSFIKQNTDFAWFSFPIDLISGLINLVPSFILPNKMSIMPSIFDMGYNISAPFGALSVFVSMIVNFGVIGTVMAFFFVGLILGYFEKRAESLEMVLIGCFIAGFVGFDFFRNPFSLSIIKNMFQTSFLQPLLVFKLISVLYNNGFNIYTLKMKKE